MNIDELPNELKFQILLNLSNTELINLCKTNNEFNTFCHDEYFWKKRLEKDFPYIKLKYLKYKNEYNKIYYYQNASKILIQDYIHEDKGIFIDIEGMTLNDLLSFTGYKIYNPLQLKIFLELNSYIIAYDELNNKDEVENIILNVNASYDEIVKILTTALYNHMHIYDVNGYTTRYG